MPSPLGLILLSFSFVLLHEGRVTPQRLSEKKCQEYLRMYKHWRSRLIPQVINPNGMVITAAICSKSGDSIVNSTEAGRGEFPHQALLGYSENGIEEYEFRCGGSLISERFVLTAAHCGSPQIVRLGEHSLSEAEDEVDYEVERFFKHLDYTLKSSYNDIALVKLVSEAKFSILIRPACLWTNKELNVSSVLATGFGNTEFAGTGSDVLLKVELVVKPKASCLEKFELDRRFKRGIGDEQLCLGSQYGGEDTCQGDSGGPIQMVLDPKMCWYHIVGVTSVGTSCGIGKAENIYTQVASYLDWIEDMVWPGERELYGRKEDN